MKRLVIDDFAEIAAIMYEKVITDSCSDVMFIGYYEDVACVVKELMMYSDVMPFNITLQPDVMNGYDKEYYVALDSELDLWCSEAYDCDNECYFDDVTDFALISEDCNSTILKNIECNIDNMYEVSYYVADEEFEECECDGNCACCGLYEDGNVNASELNKKENKVEKKSNTDKHEIFTRIATDDNGQLKGFEKTWESKDGNMNYKTTYSFFSNNQDMLKDMLNKFDKF